MNRSWREAEKIEREARGHLQENRTPEVARAWWASIAEVLSSFRQEAAGSTPYPAEVLFLLERIADDLARGVVNQLIGAVVKRGAPPRSSLERRDLRFAVAYLRAAREGLDHRGERIEIDDPEPIETVRQLYGAERDTTVRGWMADPDLAPADDLGPLDADVLTSQMKVAAARYASAGGTHSAITARQSKQPNG